MCEKSIDGWLAERYTPYARNKYGPTANISAITTHEADMEEISYLVMVEHRKNGKQELGTLLVRELTCAQNITGSPGPYSIDGTATPQGERLIAELGELGDALSKALD